MNVNLMLMLRLLHLNCRSIVGRVAYLRFLLNLNMHLNRGVITIQDLWLNHLHNNCLVSLHCFNINRQDYSIRDSVAWIEQKM